MTDTLALATLLRGATDDALADGLKMRAITPVGIRDFFDLADALLDADSLAGCLTLLDRRLLGALWELGTTGPTADIDHDALASLRAMLLLDGNDLPWRAVIAQLESWPSLGLPSPTTFNDPLPGPDAAVSESTDGDRTTADAESVAHSAAEHAFSATSAIAELLFELERGPARLLAKGDLGLPETRRLAEVMAVEDSAASTLIAAAERAGLIERDHGRLVAASEHREWLAGTASERWLTLVAGWAEELPATIREQLAEHTEVRSIELLLGWLDWLYPGGGTWLREKLEARLAEAQQLGITADGELSSAGAAVLRGDHPAAAELLAAQLPEPVRELYLQHDLTLVAPGPLAAEIDVRLRGMAEVEGRALASRFRLTSASIESAIASGESADTILEFLGSISITPIPQPVVYLVQESAGRHGRLRVGAVLAHSDAAGDGTAPGGIDVSYIRSEDSALLGAVLVDSRLAVLGLTARSVNEVVSRRERDQVYWALVDARYPAAAEDANGRVVTLRHEEPPRTIDAPPDRIAALVQKLRLADDGASDDTGQAWLARQLEAAIRTKSTVTVSVRMPNGTVVDHALEPASVSGGRLRAKDPVSEIERTLPLSSIAAVSVV